MSKNGLAVCRICRREGEKLYLKGEKCYTKCTIERRPYPPGQHGQARRRKVSDYGVQLRAKQRARKIYGVIETQFRNYYEDAARRKGETGLELLRRLELRFDNIVYRAGFGSSRAEARQLVTHRHFSVNGRTANVPSMRLRPGDIVTVRSGSADIEPIARSQEMLNNRPMPGWLALEGALSVRVEAEPPRDEMEPLIEEHLIVEFYSR
ncbi:MAG: small subunit ribosomal protein [Chloroflexota bacterium]|jgi:small subunit ribosomal protein S4|nr:small subunit ribosomal protein [Chloroflexota bacterium]